MDRGHFGWHSEKIGWSEAILVMERGHFAPRAYYGRRPFWLGVMLVSIFTSYALPATAPQPALATVGMVNENGTGSDHLLRLTRIKVYGDVKVNAH
jgi:hypothetical protein